jgi:hypothetical protein
MTWRTAMVLHLLLIGLAIALDPLPLSAFVVILPSESGVREGAAFLFGWLVSLAVVVTVCFARLDAGHMRSSRGARDAAGVASVRRASCFRAACRRRQARRGASGAGAQAFPRRRDFRSSSVVRRSFQAMMRLMPRTRSLRGRPFGSAASARTLVITVASKRRSRRRRFAAASPTQLQARRRSTVAARDCRGGMTSCSPITPPTALRSSRPVCRSCRPSLMDMPSPLPYPAEDGLMADGYRPL